MSKFCLFAKIVIHRDHIWTETLADINFTSAPNCHRSLSVKYSVSGYGSSRIRATLAVEVVVVIGVVVVVPVSDGMTNRNRVSEIASVFFRNRNGHQNIKTILIKMVSNGPSI